MLVFIGGLIIHSPAIKIVKSIKWCIPHISSLTLFYYFKPCPLGNDVKPLWQLRCVRCKCFLLLVCGSPGEPCALLWWGSSRSRLSPNCQGTQEVKGRTWWGLRFQEESIGIKHLWSVQGGYAESQCLSELCVGLSGSCRSELNGKYEVCQAGDMGRPFSHSSKLQYHICPYSVPMPWPHELYLAADRL